jgi:hypothetical protein
MKSMPVIEGKVAAGNNIRRRICVCAAQQRKKSKKSYHIPHTRLYLWSTIDMNYQQLLLL